jgi:hypothetical protein
VDACFRIVKPPSRRRGPTPSHTEEAEAAETTAADKRRDLLPVHWLTQSYSARREKSGWGFRQAATCEVHPPHPLFIKDTLYFTLFFSFISENKFPTKNISAFS